MSKALKMAQSPEPVPELDIKAIEFKLSVAKATLIFSQPFYAALSCNMNWVHDDSIPTMATDGKVIYWNAGFVDNMTADECQFVICHEILHCVFQHMSRLHGRDHYNWNIACDAVINDMLVKDKIGTMPKCGVLMPDLIVEGQYLAENVYNLLPPPLPKDKRGGYGTGKPGPLDDLLAPVGSPAELAAQSAEMRVMIAQAAQVAKMRGKLSAGLARIVGDLVTPKVPWQDVMRRFISHRAKVEPSYARPKRRFSGEDFYLPSFGGQRLGEIVFAVDCSGSIGEKELTEFATEVMAVKSECAPRVIHILYFDSAISHYDRYEDADGVKIQAHGGGGTDFAPIFAKISELGIEAEACIVLTDLCCNSYGLEPACPVLWVSNYVRGTPPPFGDVVYM